MRLTVALSTQGLHGAAHVLLGSIQGPAQRLVLAELGASPSALSGQACGVAVVERGTNSGGTTCSRSVGAVARVVEGSSLRRLMAVDTALSARAVVSWATVVREM